MDTPAYLRKEIHVRREEPQAPQQEEETRSEQNSNVAPFRQSTERIRKDDSDQPAFLRKIMD